MSDLHLAWTDILIPPAENIPVYIFVLYRATSNHPATLPQLKLMLYKRRGKNGFVIGKILHIKAGAWL